MEKTGVFTEDEIQKVTRSILATTIHFVDGLMEQSATDEYVTQIVADADLAYLGGDAVNYWEEAKDLLREIKKQMICQERT